MLCTCSHFIEGDAGPRIAGSRADAFRLKHLHFGPFLIRYLTPVELPGLGKDTEALTTHLQEVTLCDDMACGGSHVGFDRAGSRKERGGAWRVVPGFAAFVSSADEASIRGWHCGGLRSTPYAQGAFGRGAVDKSKKAHCTAAAEIYAEKKEEQQGAWMSAGAQSSSGTA